MENQIINLIKDLSYPAVIALALIIFNKAGIFNLISDFFRSKINGNTDITIHEKLDLVANNHLHEVVEILKRIEISINKDHERMENKLDKVSDEVAYLQGKLNGK